MIVYILLAISPLFLYVLFQDRYEKGRYCLICGFVIFLFFAIRSEYVGNPDTHNYVNIMRYAINSSSWIQFRHDKGMIETGFIFLVYCLSKVSSSPQLLLVITGVIYALSISTFIYLNSEYPLLSFLIYITLGMMLFEFTAMRQAIAICICLFAFQVLTKKKYVLFFALVAVAILFHQTAVCFLVFLPLSFLSYSKKNTILVILASVVAIFSAERIISFANAYFERAYTNVITSGGIIMLICFFLPVLLTWMFRKTNDEIDEDKTSTLLYYGAIVGLGVYLMRYFGAQAAERISFYFFFCQIILIPNCIKWSTLPGNKKILTVGVIVFSLLLFIYRIKSSDFIPYIFFWG